MQGVGAVLGGTIAQFLGHGTTGVAWTMATLAALSLAVTISLTPGLRRSQPVEQHEAPAGASRSTELSS